MTWHRCPAATGHPSRPARRPIVPGESPLPETQPPHRAVRRARARWLAVSALALVVSCLAPALRAAEDDELLAAARRYVEQSDRYLHHGKLRRGMKGYGLTVLEGVKIVRFNVEIVSVVANWSPHQAVILAMLFVADSTRKPSF